MIGVDKISSNRMPKRALECAQNGRLSSHLRHLRAFMRGKSTAKTRCTYAEPNGVQMLASLLLKKSA